MTRTGISPRLGQHLPEPFVEIHPDDASKFGVDRWRFRARRHRLRTMHPQGRGQRAAAARHAVRADPLERARPHPPRASARWWRRSPIRFPASPRTRRRRRRSRRTNTSSAASRCRARSSNLPGACLVGARRASPAATAICSPTMPISRDGNPGCASVAGDDLAEYTGFRRRRLSRGVVCRRPHRDLPVRRPGARCRRLGRGQEPVRGGCAQRRSAPHAAVGQIDRRPGQCRPDRLRLFRRRPQHDLRCHRGRRELGRRDRRASSRPAPIAARAFRN